MVTGRKSRGENVRLSANLKSEHFFNKSSKNVILGRLQNIMINHFLCLGHPSDDRQALMALGS